MERLLAHQRILPHQVGILLAPAADPYLEQMARRAKALTLRRFGRVVVLYAPLYLSNWCVNACRYCGFRSDRHVARRALSAEQLAAEMAYLKEAGFQHLLLVSGEDPHALPLSDLLRAVRAARRLFASVSIEVYPLPEEQYRLLVEEGCDGIALYQETYDPEQYLAMHPRGPKRDYRRRLEAIEGAARAGFRSLGIGALLGLSCWRTEGVFLAAHAAFLMKRYWRCRIAFSFPRLCPASEDFTVPHPVSDRDLVHLMCALRLAFPDGELVVSTRERPEFRDNLIRLGIANRFSAGSRTEPGGYTQKQEAQVQFEVHDRRSPQEVAHVIAQAGYEPVWKDWDRAYLSSAGLGDSPDPMGSHGNM